MKEWPPIIRNPNAIREDFKFRDYSILTQMRNDLLMIREWYTKKTDNSTIVSDRLTYFCVVRLFKYLDTSVTRIVLPNKDDVTNYEPGITISRTQLYQRDYDPASKQEEGLTLPIYEIERIVVNLLKNDKSKHKNEVVLLSKPNRNGGRRILKFKSVDLDFSTPLFPAPKTPAGLQALESK